MLSIVPLMNGGGMYETGAGGSAPKHAALVQENHLRWDSLGEFLALAVSLEELGIKENNARAKLLAKTLDAATGVARQQQVAAAEDRSAGQSWFAVHLAMYWAQELAGRPKMRAAAHFAPLAKALSGNEEKIVAELRGSGQAGRHRRLHRPDTEKCNAVMRPSPTLNAALKAAQA